MTPTLWISLWKGCGYWKGRVTFVHAVHELVHVVWFYHVCVLGGGKCRRGEGGGRRGCVWLLTKCWMKCVCVRACMCGECLDEFMCQHKRQRSNDPWPYPAAGCTPNAIINSLSIWWYTCTTLLQGSTYWHPFCFKHVQLQVYPWLLSTYILWSCNRVFN